MTSKQGAPAQCFEVFTLFPEAIEQFAKAGLLGKAAERGLVEVRTTNFRDFATDKHRTVDDSPFGGGAGMVMKPEPVVAALESVQEARGPMHRVLLTPSAPRFDQRAAERLAQHNRIGLLCGRYEGIDDRVREHFVDECFSIGDFVLNGGEVAALTVIEAVSRLRKGVLGNPQSAKTESFATASSGSYLEHPHYTRPSVFRGHAVPDVLLAGNHQNIEAWRLEQARARTFALRPDLRPPARLPSSVEVHVAVPASATPSAALVDVIRKHRVTSLVVLGGGPDGLMPWVRETGGRIAVAGRPSLKQLRRRLRQRHGHAPWVVALERQGSANDAQAESGGDPGISTDPAWVLDVLGDPPAEGVQSLILVAGLRSKGLDADAVYAPHCTDASPDASPDATEVGLGAQTQEQELASRSGIEDSSRPPVVSIELLDSALAGLLSNTE